MPTATSAAVLVPTATPTTAQAIAPTATPTTPVSTCPQANSAANLRGGPGTGYAVVGSVPQGDCITITGRTEVSDWFQIGPGVWIAAFLVANPGLMADIPVVVVAALTPVPAVPTAVPVVPTQAPQQEQTTPVPPTAVPQAPAQNCDSSYPTVCIPPYPPDLDCGEISFRRFQVVGSDPHGFDGDNDGIGCES